MTDADTTTRSAMTDTRKLMILGVTVVVLCAIGITYVLWAGGRAAEDLAVREARALEAIESFSNSTTPTPIATTAPGATVVPERLASVDAEALSPGDVLVVNRVPGEDYRRLTVVRPDGTRTMLDRRCDRVHVGGGIGACAAPVNAALGGWETLIFDASVSGLPVISDHSSAFPSRMRVAADGSVVTATGFVTGRSYADVGGDATTIVVLLDVAEDKLSGLVQYELDRPALSTEAAQYWGVSFADPAGDTFYATAHLGDGPVVVRGERESRTLSQPLFDGSCPSVSPDGSKMVYKAARPEGGFDLAVHDLATGETRLLNEQRSVDDQVEWLDDDTILYALHADGEADEAVDPSFDIWKLDLAEGSEPELFIPAASSPAVVR